MAGEGLRAWGNTVEIVYRAPDKGDGKVRHLPVGEVKTEIIEGNVVITVYREDEAYFGPVSLVVV